MARTEREILKDFKNLGFEVKENSCSHLILQTPYFVISINKISKVYSSHVREKNMGSTINIFEHKLLHELFTCWGWI